MSHFQGLGERVREARESLGLTVEQLATEVSCRPEMLHLLEQNRPVVEVQALLPVLERIAARASVGVDALLLADTNLFLMRVNELKMSAFGIIREHRWTGSLEIVAEVFRQIEDQCERALAESKSGALAFRGKGNERKINEDSVYEMVLTAKRLHN